MSANITLLLLFFFSSVLADDRPVFKGGQRKLTSFIDNNLIYPEFAKDNCLQGTVYVSFRLNPEGKIYDSEVQKGFGVDLDKEALRVVRLSSGKWIVPPTHDTLLKMVLPVNFSLREFKCEQRSKDQINAAISAYHAREGLNKVIYNFYQKKTAGCR